MRLVISLVFILFLLLGGVIYIYITNDNEEDKKVAHTVVILNDDNSTMTPFEEEKAFQKDKFESSWDDIESSLTNAVDTYSKILEIQDRDDKSILDKILDKESSLKDDLYTIFQELIVDELRDSRIEDYKSNIIDVQEDIIDLKISIKENEELLIEAPIKSWFSSTKDDYKDIIKDLENEIKEYNIDIKNNNNSIRAYIRTLGLNLSDDKIDLLRKRVDFIDMIDMVLVINMIDMTMSQLTKNMGKDKLNYNNSIKYYSINQTLFELVIYKAKEYIKHIENQYIKNLIKLDAQNKKLYQSDKIKFIQEKSRIKRKIYKDSMKALKLFKDASTIYKNDLLRQKIRLLKIIYISSSNLEASKTQYQTSKHSLERLKPIRDMRGEFQKMREIFLDIRAKFKNSRIKNKYIEIISKLR